MGKAEHPFTNVDAQPDPGVWISALDRLREDPSYAAYKRRLSELIDPRPGGRYLEVGCGTGSDAMTFGERFGVDVVGVDASSAMVAEAARRGLQEAVLADAHSLPFPSASFDGAWADRTVQHLADPDVAVGELVRVVRPGGTVLVADPDYATQVVNVPDQELATRVLAFKLRRRHASLAHQMSRLFTQAGLTSVAVEVAPIVVRDPEALDHALGLRDWAGLAADQGLLPRADVAAWESALDEAASNGWFLYSFSLFITHGRKPLPGS
jgi:SAM-dependent methyltransferase